VGVSIPRSIRSCLEPVGFVGCGARPRINDRGIVERRHATGSSSPKPQMMILLSATAENLAGNSVKSALTRIFPVPSFPHMDHGREFLSCRKMLTSLRILVAGGGIEPPTLGL